MSVEIGVYTFGEVTPDQQTGRMVSPAQRLRGLIEEIELADQVGLGPARQVGERGRARSYGVTYGARNARSSVWSIRYPPPFVQFGLIPNEVTATMVVDVPAKIGPPESPKQVPPLLLLEKLAEIPFPTPYTPFRLFCFRMATRRVSPPVSFASSPYPTAHGRQMIRIQISNRARFR